ncbi:hypothetical protein GOARA_021_01540 [Gordonia araii NBRC 100433]|uniref:Uncharacterized protein n=1 Tax=Gordonia araii NBRC 100433 TaxID=1073574 RepID=G7GZ91_9ACTN|nr:hypothetical protein [Gordonia araii]NNG97124.1 hypothetical protein [Gordonia araii NBRC 100433]GAB08916.1 hypothetical protein GOARA_021_01540 [Gordonia araii NBRC 100433]
MTRNSAEKRAARAYAQEHGVAYRQAVEAIRRNDADQIDDSSFVHRILIEAVEGCGIRHWAQIVEWDGERRAVARDLGGETFELTLATLASELREFRSAAPEASPLDIDSYIADEVVQASLFGAVIYRRPVRR